MVDTICSFYFKRNFVEINWGSSVQAHTYRRALDATLKLGNVQEHVKNFRPQMLVLAGNPMCRPALVDLATQVTHGHSLMICGNVIIVRNSRDSTLIYL
jgi:hypothetical protein